jgi:hypothetical protein
MIDIPQEALEWLRARSDAVTKNFVAMILRAMAKGTPEEVAVEESGLAEIFEMLLPGEGGIWVHANYRIAREMRKTAS